MKSSVFNLISTVFLLWLTIQIRSDYEVYLAYFFVLTVGIMHGANDVALISMIASKADKSLHKYLIFYVSLIILTTVAFIVMPIGALFVFIGFSCYHFGEQHFNDKVKENNYWAKLLYTSYGALIFGLLFSLNTEGTSTIINELTGVTFSATHFQSFLIIAAALTAISVYINLKNFESGINYFQEFFLILLMSILFELASLLWAFAIYFVIWHSIPSLKDQVVVLYGKMNRSSFLKYMKSSILNWVISITGLIIVYYVSTFLKISFITLFFAFLAAITIPHVIVMFHLNKK
ncbi:MAG: Brp/Blh family beta-carotene 15,15'-dioxygenase [Crocinitomicaceae bacterium]|nr:Brp/Blh family beta-carotene 15,15'-dioxygenase [Crocinitomicaceae bacterium]